VKQITKRKQRKLEKKRKQAKQAKKRQSQGTDSLAYHGSKYRTRELVPLQFETELAIHEVDVVCNRRLADREVFAALVTLIEQVRSGRLPKIDPDKPLQVGPDDNVEPVLWNIRGHWDHFFNENPHPGRDKLAGMLRSILGSIETWSGLHPGARGYLDFLEGFCAKLGARVDVVESEEELARLLPDARFE